MWCGAWWKSEGVFSPMLMSDGTLEYVFIVLIALAFDLAFGELPNRLHPVAGLGRIISWELKLAPKGKLGQLGYGTFTLMAARSNSRREKVNFRITAPTSTKSRVFTSLR
jgi:hypothetical protein